MSWSIVITAEDESGPDKRADRSRLAAMLVAHGA